MPLLTLLLTLAPGGMTVGKQAGGRAGGADRFCQTLNSGRIFRLVSGRFWTSHGRLVASPVSRQMCAFIPTPPHHTATPSTPTTNTTTTATPPPPSTTTTEASTTTTTTTTTITVRGRARVARGQRRPLAQTLRDRPAVEDDRGRSWADLGSTLGRLEVGEVGVHRRSGARPGPILPRSRPICGQSKVDPGPHWGRCGVDVGLIRGRPRVHLRPISGSEVDPGGVALGSIQGLDI